MNSRIPEISVVVPLYNEEDSVIELNRLITDTLDETNRTYQIIYVDDGSCDQTIQKLLSLSDPHQRITILSLKGNSGQTAALAAGFDHAVGKIVLSMDGDLQHDPREIPNFLKGIDEGYDIVSGWREQRVDPYWSRKLPSRIANGLMARLSGIPIHDFGTTYKAYRSEVVKSISLYGDFHRFIPALIEGMKVRIKEIPIKSLPRTSGKSNYSLSRTITVAFDLIRIHFLTKYLNKPLQAFGSVGFGLGFSGFLIALYLTYVKLFHGISIMTSRGPLFLLSILLMLIGTQCLTLGLLGELIVKLYHNLPGSRIYTVQNILHPDRKDPSNNRSTD